MSTSKEDRKLLTFLVMGGHWLQNTFSLWNRPIVFPGQRNNRHQYSRVWNEHRSSKDCVRMAEEPNEDFCFEGTVKSLKLEISILKSRTMDKRNMVCRVPISYLVTKLHFFPSLMSISGHLCAALNVKTPKSVANEYQCNLHFWI